MLLISSVKLPLNADFSDLKQVAANELKIPISEVLTVELYKKSVDARKKDNIVFVVSLIVSVKNETELLKKKPQNMSLYKANSYESPMLSVKPLGRRPIIVGSGPAGLFCALTLAKVGLCPIVLERGKPANERVTDINLLEQDGKLDRDSNILFGEGGAGTFSDGKLNTGITDFRVRHVISEFVRFGAPPEIEVMAKPHIGTDYLQKVVSAMRDEIARFGGEFRFSCKLRSLNIEDGSIAAAITGEEEIPVDRLVLAIGHSARDTIEMLFDSGLNMQKKPFSVGFRVEHTQEFINKAMYGKFADHPALTAADYKFAVKTVNTHFVKTAPQRGVYTFCMCPGGSVVNSSSEQGGVCTNGMSRFSRNSGYSNSAVLASVAPEDLVSDHPLAGITLQREIECAAFEAAGGGYKAPAMSSREFVKKGAADSIFSTYLPAVTHADIESLFPTFIADSLKQGMMILEGNVKGFTLGDGVITAPETRSSSPVRIVRDEQFMTSVSGIYACGEGSGYAGGIMSSAVDGIKCAEAVIRGIQNG